MDFHEKTPIRRIARLREKKVKQIEAANMLEQVKGHKQKSERLKKKVEDLHQRIADHTSGEQELVPADVAQDKVKKLDSLQLSLKTVQKLAVDLHDANELSSSQWNTLSDHIKRLAHLIKVQKARFERDLLLLDDE